MWLGIEIKEDVARKRKLKRMWLGIEIKGCGSEEEIIAIRLLCKNHRVVMSNIG